jgi:hypothetical protein|tara:strand:+ start:417 stop:641 length:225 start_codon:yes stop_codon:yes gene_type:complete
MATTKDMVGSVAKGDLNTANDTFKNVMAAKVDNAWDAARIDVARTSFDAPEEPMGEADPVDTGITGDPAEVEEE